MNYKNLTTIAFAAFALAAPSAAEAQPGDWKTWVISSGGDHAVPAPPGPIVTRAELAAVESLNKDLDPAVLERIRFWDSGPPSYRWMDLIVQRQLAGKTVGSYPARAYAYVSIAIYDATIAAWKAKETYRRERPTEFRGTSIQPRVAIPASFSYPSDYAATAAAAAEVMAYLVPAEADYFRALAEEAGQTRLLAGVEYPSDYQAGLDLGRRIAAQVVAKARADGSDIVWTGVVPTGRCLWTGTNPGNVAGANFKPLLLTTPSEFRPAPPPDCESPEAQAQLAEVKSFPRALNSANFNTNSKAFYWQTAEGVFPWAFVHLNRWMLEDRMETNPPLAARAYALTGAAGYDAFIASQDGKFAYWYLRPAQLDSTLVPLFPAPNFPSYPSNHSTFSTARAEVLAYLFPDRAEFIRALGKEAGDSRIWAGIHYQMDNQAGVTLGKKVAEKFVAWAKADGSGK
jgi:membrane-associated phospholipid phosphatase